jgi:hypothetical protein
VFVRSPTELAGKSLLVYPVSAILEPIHGRFPGDVDRMDETGTMKIWGRSLQRRKRK